MVHLGVPGFFGPSAPRSCEEAENFLIAGFLYYCVGSSDLPRTSNGIICLLDNVLVVAL